MKPIKRTKKGFNAAALFADFRKLRWDAAGPMTWCFSFRCLAGAAIVKATAEALKIVEATLGSPPARVWPVRYSPDPLGAADPRFAQIQFSAILTERDLSQLHAAFEALACKHGIDYGGVIACPALSRDLGQPAAPAPSMKFDAAALFAHLRELDKEPEARRFHKVWHFSFHHQDFQHLSGVAETLLDGMIATLGRTPRRLEPSLAETQLHIDERGNKTNGPPVAEIVFTDYLAENELAKLHLAFKALAERHEIVYEGLACYDPPDADWVRGPVLEPKSRRRLPKKGKSMTLRKKIAKNPRRPRR